MAGVAGGAGRSARAAELAGAQRLYAQVMGDPGGLRGPGAAGLTRRVMVATAGMTLLAGCGVAASSKSGARAAPGSLGHTSGPRATATGAAGPAGATGTSAPGAGAGSNTGAPPTADPTTPAATTDPTDPSSPGGTGAPVAGSGPNVVNGGPVPAGSVIQTKPQYYVDAGPKVIALTLDDGPSQYTPQILEILAQYKVIATFCMIGRQVAGSASIVREVAAAGHQITNHTWDHKDQSKLARPQVQAELDRTSEALNDLGITPTMYRAPFGSWSPTVFEVAAGAGLRVLDWSVDPKDWSMPGVGSIVNTIMKHTSTGKIILDHDGGGNRSQTVAAMKIWLPQLLADGYRFTTP
ncbi:MAG TPA: polysaccharide deacetylase family protein [Actinocrinis sp.]|nr:polysaccharide deacetylase family protein [Actinocrinis sp.]